MNKIQRTNQGGSIVLFIIVSIILTLGLIIGVYILKQRGQQARHDQTIAVVDKKFEADNNKNKEETTKNTTKDNSVSVGVPNFTNSDANKSKDLPATGPEINIINLLGSGILTFAIFSYIGSRRNLVRSL